MRNEALSVTPVNEFLDLTDGKCWDYLRVNVILERKGIGKVIQVRCPRSPETQDVSLSDLLTGLRARAAYSGWLFEGWSAV